MTKLFIDTEFNGFGGELMSMALVAEDGKEFYEVVKLYGDLDPWVEENVVPCLLKVGGTYEQLQDKMFSFLSQYDNIEIIADWPDDIRYFCQAVIVGPGRMHDIGGFTCHMYRWLSADKSVVKHNALHDARAIRDCYMDNERNRGALV